MDRDTVIVIFRHEPGSYHSRPVFVAVASDAEAAKQWIQDEIDGKHGRGMQYAAGQTVDWWLQYGLFTMTPVPLH